MSKRSIQVKSADDDGANGSIEDDGSSSSAVMQLSKSITLINAITIVTGSVIGSGIFVSPTGILRKVRSLGASLLIWVLCGILTACGAYSYVELALMLPKAGGDYSYIMDGYGRLIGFLRLWIEVMVVRPGSIAIIAIVFATYTLNPIFPTCDQPIIAVKLLAAMCILILGFINALSIRWAARVQDFFTYAKVAGLGLIIVTGIVQVGRGYTEAFEDSFEGTTTSVPSFAIAFYDGLFSNSGWNYLGNVVEEMKNPSVDFPKAMIISCGTITVLYVMANVAYVTVIPIAEMYTNDAVAVTFAQRIYGPVWWIMPILVACSTFGGVNGTVMTTSRMFYAASQEHQMPQLLSFLNLDRKTPIPAVISTCIIAIVYLAVDDVYSLINYTGFVQWMAIAASVLLVIVFRFTRPNVPRPVKTPIVFPIIFVVSVLILSIFSFVGAPQESLIGVGVIATGIPVYFFVEVWKNKPKSIVKHFDKFSIMCQKVFQLVPVDRQ